jgi:UDP-N-acetylmuramyl pentapeptide phosphotransferase/UDP-N-acetylglucosamine-1-phosphate transferase
MQWYELFLVGGVLAVLSWLLVLGVRRQAERHRILDIPNERSSHSRPVARGGGLAIAVICVIGWFVLLVCWPDENRFGMACFAGGAVMIAGISILDDIHTVSSAVRFAVHGAAAVLLLLGYGDWRIVSLPFVGEFCIGWLGVPLVFLWIVGLTNAYNFMDGIDGIAACQAITAGLGWLIVGRLNGQATVPWLALFVTASSVGFLVHNWHPAKIFMGDVGSALLGYAFAFLAVAAGDKDPRMILAGALFVWPFVFDATFTFFRRMLRGENVFAAHRSHLYQRLVIAGWSHAQTTLLYAVLDVLGMGLGILYVVDYPICNEVIVVCLPSLALGLWSLVVWQERRRQLEIVQKTV